MDSRTQRTARIGLFALLVVTLVATPASAVTGVTHEAGLASIDDGRLADHKDEQTPTETTVEQSEGDDENGAHAAQEGDEGTDDVTIVKDVDGDLVVSAAHYEKENKTYEIEFTNLGEDEAKQIVIAEGMTREAAQNADAFGVMVIEELDAGESRTVRLKLLTDDPIGVSITSEQSIEMRRMAFLSTPKPELSILDGEASWADTRMAGIAGIIGTVICVLLGMWHLVATSNEDTQEADLEPNPTRWRSSR